MSDGEQRPQHYVPVWGIFLVFPGIVFFLQSLNILPWNLWGTLWRFWPVLIIITGLGILLRRYNFWLVNKLILTLLLGCPGIAIRQHGPSIPVEQASKSYSVPLKTLEQAHVEIDFSAGSLTMGSLPPGLPHRVQLK